MFKDKWPNRLKPYLPLYWHLVLLYCIPIFATYMLIVNHFSNHWVMNASLGLFWLVFLVDWLTFIFLLLIGMFIGTLLYLVNYNNFDVFGLLKSNNEIFFAGYMYFYALLIGLIFARNKQVIEKTRLTALKSLSAAIAHEMRTPLGAIRAVGYNIRVIISGYKKFRKPLSLEDLTYLEQYLHDLNVLLNRSNSTIDIMLENLRSDVSNFSLSLLSMRQCIKTTLENYPFSKEERTLVDTALEHDFVFMGNENLMQHILFNLIKNSLYFIQVVGKGRISITLKAQENDDPDNALVFMDTAKGVSKNTLSRIFEPFFSKRPHGTGIGLSFCKRVIESWNGKILCDSKEGEHITFTLVFPPIKNSHGQSNYFKD